MHSNSCCGSHHHQHNHSDHDYSEPEQPTEEENGENGDVEHSRWIPGSIVIPSEELKQDDFESEDFVFSKVLIAFSRYEKYYFKYFDRKIRFFNKVWNQNLGNAKCYTDVKSVLPNQFENFKQMKEAIQKNYDNLILKILESHALGFSERPESNKSSTTLTNNDEPSSVALDMVPRIMEVDIPSYQFRNDDIEGILSSEDYDKVSSTIKQFVRDWSAEGSVERNESYQLILDELQRVLPLSPGGEGELNKYRVLTPGAGLGRLTWEIARLGYASQGNEFSFQMLLASNFILNHPYKILEEESNENKRMIEQFQIYPFVGQLSDLYSRSDQLYCFSIPDVHPGLELREGVDFSMVAGDFVSVYKQESQMESWDCIATCFFIDTAKNIFDYLNTIYHSLKEGGYWINLGPLLWHYHEMGNDKFSIELTYEEIKSVMIGMGFEIVNEKVNIENTYISSFGNNSRQTMRQTVYDCAFFCARKKKIVNNN